LKEEKNMMTVDKGRGRRQEYNNSGDYTRLFVNLKRKMVFLKPVLWSLSDMDDLRKDVLGKIDMKETNSWIEVVQQCRQTNDPCALDGKKIIKAEE